MQLFWLWIFYNTPYMNDDWYWGRSWGIRTTLTGSTNSRYLGNLCIVLLTRSTAFKILFPTVLVWLLHFCISRFPAELEEKHRLLIFLFSNLMLFLAEPSIWNQTIGWLAGFANYMTSGFCLVALLMIVRKSFARRNAFPLWPLFPDPDLARVCYHKPINLLMSALQAQQQKICLLS